MRLREDEAETRGPGEQVSSPVSLRDGAGSTQGGPAASRRSLFVLTIILNNVVPFRSRVVLKIRHYALKALDGKGGPSRPQMGVHCLHQGGKDAKKFGAAARESAFRRVQRSASRRRLGYVEAASVPESSEGRMCLILVFVLRCVLSCIT